MKDATILIGMAIILLVPFGIAYIITLAPKQTESNFGGDGSPYIVYTTDKEVTDDAYKVGDTAVVQIIHQKKRTKGNCTKIVRLK